MNIQHPASSIQHPDSSATYVVELTPAGRAAVAVVLVAGPDALQAVGNCFAPLNGRPIGEIPAGRIVLGRWGGVDGEELIVCRRGDEHIEIHCHGGVAAVHAVVSGLVAQGCRPLAWQDWMRRCSPDPIQAAARIALADATTERAAAILLDQLNGALRAAIRRALGEISAANWARATEILDDSLSRRELGLHLTEPWRVALFGAPNVGKSTLINALAGYERAIVSPTPGTTRDVVTVTTAIDGWPVQLADTAGFRQARDELESAGIELAAATAAAADLVLVVHDATKLDTDSVAENTNADRPLLAPTARLMHVINKVDLVSDAERCEWRVQLPRSQSELTDAMFVSALTGEGIGDLVTAISKSLVPIPPPGVAVPFTAQQIEQLAAARDAVQRRDATAVTELLQSLLV